MYVSDAGFSLLFIIRGPDSTGFPSSRTGSDGGGGLSPAARPEQSRCFLPSEPGPSVFLFLPRDLCLHALPLGFLGGAESGEEIPNPPVVPSAGLEGPEGPDGSHSMCGGGRRGVDVRCAVPGVGESCGRRGSVSPRTWGPISQETDPTGLSARRVYSPFPDFAFCVPV